MPRNAPKKSQPHLDETPPPYFDPEHHSNFSKSLSTGSRPLTVFDDPYRKRPFSTVLPDRPFSYAAYNDFDLPPSTPPGHVFRRLGVLPSPTVEATPTSYKDANEAPGNTDSQKAIGIDDSSTIAGNFARLKMLEPPAVDDGSAKHSSSRSSPVQTNPAMVGDVPVYLKTSASSQVSSLSSEKGVEETPTEEELETPRQSHFSRPIEHPSSFTSIPQISKTTQGTLPGSNEYRQQSELQNQPSSLCVQSETSLTSNGFRGNLSSIAAQQVERTNKDLPPTVGNDLHTSLPLETKPLPPASDWEQGSPYDTDAEAAVSSPTALVPEFSQGSRNLSWTSNSGILANERPTQRQDKQPQYLAERDAPLLPVLTGPVATGSVENTPLANGTARLDISHESIPHDRLPSSPNGSRPGTRVHSDSLKSRSPDVSPERQYETVNHESNIQKQSRTPTTHEREPQSQYRASSQGRSRPFSFAEYSTDDTVPAVSSQGQILREGQWEPGYENHQDPLLDGSSSFNIPPERPTIGEPSNQRETSRGPQDEKLRHSITVPYRHHPSILGSSHDPNILEHPAHRQGQQPVAQDLPLNYYPAETRREEGILPRHQSTEYQLTGIGPPQAERAPQKRRSSSRSSIFFKGLSRGNSSRTDVPKMPSVGGRTTSDQPDGSDPLSKRATKRTSMFRSFTQRRGSESGRSNDSIVAQAPGSRTDLLQQSGSLTPQPLQDTLPSEHNPKESQSNLMRKRLRRRSTPGGVEPEDGKRKRFSFKVG